MIKERTLITFIAAMLLLVSMSCMASAKHSSIKTKTKELKNITRQITGLKNNLNKERKKLPVLEKELNKAEVAVGKQYNKLTHTEKKLKEQQTILVELKKQRSIYQGELHQHQNALAKQVRAGYILGRNNYLRLFLDQRNPSEVSRAIRYYQYINQARFKIIQQLENTITKLARNQKQIESHTNTLRQLDAKQTKQHVELKKQLLKRQRILNELKSNIKSKKQKLKQLSSDKKVLKRLLVKLKAKAIQLKKAKIPFGSMKGKLHWPIKGSIIRTFGSTIYDSELTYDGVLIAAKVGTAVHAISSGRVVFADWLRGVGLLIIIQHDKGFMTLYGHNHSLKVKVGDYVKSNQIIASVGKSGGYDRSGLYFQIRKNGNALNPKFWCNR